MSPGSESAILVNRWSVHMVEEEFQSYPSLVKTVENGNSLSLSGPQ